MTSAVVQLIGFIIALIGGICMLTTAFMPQWKRGDTPKDPMATLVHYEGIWIQCVSFPVGTWQCQGFTEFFVKLPTTVQVGRGLMCTAISCGILAVLFSMLGMECTSCMGSSRSYKQRMAVSSGILWIVAGILTGIAVSFYAQKVMRDFRKPLNVRLEANSKFIYGSCLYIGWATMVILPVGGAMMVAASINHDHRDREIPYITNNYRTSHQGNLSIQKSNLPDFSSEYV